MHLTDRELRELIADAAGLSSRRRVGSAPPSALKARAPREGNGDRKNDDRFNYDI